MFSCKTSDIVFDTGNYIFENQTDCKTYFVKVDTIDDAIIIKTIFLKSKSSANAILLESLSLQQEAH